MIFKGGGSTVKMKRTNMKWEFQVPSKKVEGLTILGPPIVDFWVPEYPQN